MAQSTVADKVNEDGVEYVYYRQDLFKPVELLTQLHDAIVIQIPLSLPWIEHARIVRLIIDSLEKSLYWHGQEIKTPVDLSIGKNMCKELMIEYKSKDLPTTADPLSRKLQEAYDELGPKDSE
jgi:hypothetical protein